MFKPGPGIRNVQIDAHRIVPGPNNNYTVFLDQASAGQPVAQLAPTQTFAPMQPQAHPTSSYPFYFAPGPFLPPNTFIAAAPNAAASQLPGAGWQQAAAPTAIYAPAQQIYRMPAAPLPSAAQVAPPSSAATASAPGAEPLSQQHTKRERKPLQIIDPSTNSEVVIEAKDVKDKPPAVPRGTVYYNAQAQQAAHHPHAPAQPPVGAPSHAHATGHALQNSVAAGAPVAASAPPPHQPQQPLTAVKSSASNDDASGGTLTASRGATPTADSAPASAPAASAHDQRPQRSPPQTTQADEAQKNLIYNQFALNIAQAAGPAEPAPPAAPAQVAQAPPPPLGSASKIPATDTGFRFGFFDDSGLAGSSTSPTPNASPEKLANGRLPTTDHASVSVSVHQRHLEVSTADSRATLVEASCSTSIVVAPSLEQQLAAKLTPGAWFFNNTDGLRVYSRDYMLVLADAPLALGPPDVSASTRTDLLVQPPRRSVKDLMKLPRRADDVADGSAGGAGLVGQGGAMAFSVSWMQGQSGPARRPYNFQRNSAGGGSMGGQGGRPSQSGQGARRPQAPPMVIPRPSLTAPEVQLKRTDKAWKPIRQQDANKDAETIKTDALYRDVKSILNKITPQTFDELSHDFFNLDERMDTQERILGVIDILFQKVCDEPTFTCIYGQLCEYFRQRQTEQQQQGQRKTELRLFSYYLLIKCQTDFEKEKSTEAYREEKLQAIEKAETDEEKNRLKNNLEEDLVKYKWRTLGSMRFVGELYKRSLLTKFIAYLCVQRLMERITKNDKSEVDEETVLCLCKFIETIGRKLEEDKSEAKDKTKNVPPNLLDVVLKSLKSFIGQKQNNVPLRIQFEVQNLVELKENKWVPRRAEAGPKTIKEVHSEAKLEEMTKKIELDSQNMRKQSQHVNYGGAQGSGSYYGGGGGQQRQQGGSRMSQRSSHTNLSSYGGQDFDDGGGMDRLGNRGGGGKKLSQGGRASQDRSAQMRGPPVGSRGPPSVAAGPAPGAAYNESLRPFEINSLSKHSKSTAETMSLAPQRPTTWGAQKKGSLPAPAPSANRFAALNTDEDVRRRDAASRDSSLGRPSAPAPAADRQAALQAVAKLAQPGPADAPPHPPPQPVRFDAAQSSASGSSREPSASRSQSTPAAEPAGLEELRDFAHTLIDEFVDNDDYPAALDLARERQRQAGELAQLMLERVVEQRQKPRECLARLLAFFLRDQLLRPQQLALAFERCVASCLDAGLDMDVPDLWPCLGALMASVIASGEPKKQQQLALAHLHAVFRAAGPHGPALLGSLLSALHTAMPDTVTRALAGEQWASLGLQTLEQVKQLLRDHKLPEALASAASLSSSSGAEGAIGGNGMDVLQALNLQLVELERQVTDSDDTTALIHWITENVDDVTSEAFSSTLAKSLCAKAFQFLGADDDLSRFDQEFEQYCNVFLRFISSQVRLEKSLLTALTRCYYENDCPKDAFLKMLECLSRRGVVSRETFLEWWGRESSTFGMILRNNQVNRFFELLVQEQSQASP